MAIFLRWPLYEGNVVISYYLQKLGGWLIFVVVVIIFLIGLQVVQRTKQGLGLAPTPSPLQTTVQPLTNPQASTTSPSGGSSAPPTNSPSAPTPADIRSQLQVARDRLVESTVHVDKALQSISDWNAEIPSLLKTSAGDKIAEHEDLVESLTKIVHAERTPEAKLQYNAERIDTFKSQLGKRATLSSPQPLTSMEITEIDELHTAVSYADKEWSEALSNARAVKVLADARVEPGKKRSLEDEITLKAAEEKLAALEEQLLQERARKAEDAADKREQEKLDAEYRREQERLAAEREAEAKIATEEQQRKEAALITRARSTDVQSTLAPFLHPRDVQPQKVGGGSVKFQSTFDSKPMSLSALKGMGALEKSTEGLKWLARVGGHRKLSGPRWGVNSQPSNWSEDDKKLLNEAQESLRELGPILVRDGKLSP